MTRQQDLDAASRLGADLCGFIFHPSSPRHVGAAAAAGLSSGRMKRVGVFVGESQAEIERVADLACLDLIQLHGRQPAALAASLGPERVIRVLWPESYVSADDLQRAVDTLAATCAFFLLDSGMGGGGSGKKLDVRRLESIDWPRPWLLAGGLSHLNIGEILGRCSPWGLDFNSGIETAPGLKDPAAMDMALKTARLYGGK